MTLLVYPASLPMPSSHTVTPAERRTLSDIETGPRQSAIRQRGYLATQRVIWPVLSPAQAAALDRWWSRNLLLGGRWFSAPWPLPSGWLSATRRFIGPPEWRYLNTGYWSASAEMEVRGGPAPGGGDPYFDSVVLLVPFSGGINDQDIPTDTSGIDLSKYDHLLASAGSRSGGSLGGGVYYNVDPFHSLYVSKYGETVAGCNTDGAIRFYTAPEFLMGTEDFTIEMDAAQQFAGVYPCSAFGVGAPGQSGTWLIGTDATDAGRLAFYQESITDIPSIVSPSDVWTTDGVFANIAYSRVAGVGYLFANGVLVGSAPNVIDYNADLYGPGQGSHTLALNPWKGYLANIRWTSGVGRYTASYTPASGPYPTF